MIYEHVARTGNGRCRVDRWPHPRVVLAELGSNVALLEWLPPLRQVDLARGRRPSSPDNAGSLTVAARLGVVRERDDVLYTVRASAPSSG